MNHGWTFHSYLLIRVSRRVSTSNTTFHRPAPEAVIILTEPPIQIPVRTDIALSTSDTGTGTGLGTGIGTGSGSGAGPAIRPHRELTELVAPSSSVRAALATSDGRTIIFTSRTGLYRFDRHTEPVSTIAQSDQRFAREIIVFGSSLICN